MDAQRIRHTRQIVILGICAALAGGCATVQLPEMTDAAYQLEVDEKRLFNRSAEAVEAIHRSGMVYRDDALEAYLNARLTDILPKDIYAQDMDFKVEILDLGDLNAISFANGRIFFHAGFLAALENEAQLVAILSHELEHVLKRHMVIQQRHLNNKATFYNVAFGGIAPVLASFGTLSSMSGFSQEHELEADEKGLSVVKAQGYDLREAVKAYELMEAFFKDEEIKEPLFFASHPKTKARVQYLKEMIGPDNGTRIEAERYQELTRDLFFKTVDRWLAEGFYKFAKKSLERYLAREPNSALAYYYQGELYRLRGNAGKKKNFYNKDEDSAAAIKAYDQAIALDPNLGVAYGAKGRILRSLQREAEAKDNFKRYLMLVSDAPDKAFVEMYVGQP